VRLIALALSALGLAGCAFPYPPPALAPVTLPAPSNPAASIAPAQAAAPVTILVSIDGFRPDYLDRGVTPNLDRLKTAGISAAMRPSFPSVTFPNHWTLVTGMRPDRSGIVGNRMEDARRPGEVFTMQTDDPFWWSDAEPIWVTAEKMGIRTATMFWPGANVAIGGTRATSGHHAVSGGTRPSDWQQYNEAVTGEQRVATVIDWLRRPAATRPRLITLYFDIVDTAGHDGGPADPRTTAAVAKVDAQIGALIAGLAEIGQPANIVVVADHGMAATSSSRTVALADLADPADLRTIETGPVASIVPLPGREDAVARRLLRSHDHVQCWRKAAIPARFHYGRNRRVAPFVCLAETGWLIVATPPTVPFSGGAHGYDPADPAMAALFIASGPAFVGGKRLASFDNVDVAPLLRDLIGLPPGRDLDGDDAPFRAVLKR
jgi:predicted AlkP superfamily pyrophosphatase or phosphodiesterase